MHTFSPGLFNVSRHVNTRGHAETRRCVRCMSCPGHPALRPRALSSTMPSSERTVYLIHSSPTRTQRNVLSSSPIYQVTRLQVVEIRFEPRWSGSGVETHVYRRMLMFPQERTTANINRIVSMSISGWWVFERLFTFSFLLSCILNPVQRRCTFF